MRKAVSLVVLVLLVGLVFVGSGFAGKAKTFEWEYSEEEAKLYKIDIHQVTPDSGITTGHIIAYGHYIKPPYKVEVKDTIVYVNGVQIYPVLMPEGMKEKSKEDSLFTNEWKEKMKRVKSIVEGDSELVVLIRQASKAYMSSAKKGHVAYEAAADVFRNHPRVEKVKVYGNFICVFFKGMEEGYELLRRDLDPSLRKSPEEIAKILEQEEEMRKKDWEVLYIMAKREGYPPNKYGLKLKGADGEAKFVRELLSNGSGEIIETNSTETIGEETIVFIVRVLRDRFLSPQEKTYILKSKWHMHNYIPSEWPTLREIKRSWKYGKEYLDSAKQRIRVGKKEAREFIEKLESVRKEIDNEK